MQFLLDSSFPIRGLQSSVHRVHLCIAVNGFFGTLASAHRAVPVSEAPARRMLFAAL